MPLSTRSERCPYAEELLCENDAPHLITHVETMGATTQDDQALLPIHIALQNKDLLPTQHIVDAGYTNSFRLADSQQDFGVDLVGKVAIENGWQAHTTDALPLSAFRIDFDQKRVTCPANQESNSWLPGKDGRGQPVIHVYFPRQLCLKCPLMSRCTRNKARGRGVSFRPQAQHEALQHARERQETQAFKDIYAKRSGIEGTLAQSIRRSDLRQARYRGLQKNHLQHVFVAIAVNVVRLFDWFAEKPLAKTRQTPFAKLAPVA
jgi:transposase